MVSQLSGANYRMSTRHSLRSHHILATSDFISHVVLSWLYPIERGGLKSTLILDDRPKITGLSSLFQNCYCNRTRYKAHCCKVATVG